MTPADKIQRFKSLHLPGDPLILLNAWDAGSATVLDAAGAPAIATASWACAAAHGETDGERLALDLALANLERIIAAVKAPVSFDLEAGYGADPKAVAASVAHAIKIGAAGLNLEDKRPGMDGLLSVDEQCARLNAARGAGAYFLNARTDVFLERPALEHAAALDEALRRASAYAGAGADGVFIPGLTDPALIARFCAASPLPVNVMALDPEPVRASLAEAGVARVSTGPGAYRALMTAFGERAEGLYRREAQPA
ncbi:isocitrate lyase/PEP mutase family protein [Maricaulaceae bacterium MS644]